jgi:hypothetical protein
VPARDWCVRGGRTAPSGSAPRERAEPANGEIGAASTWKKRRVNARRFVRIADPGAVAPKSKKGLD